MDRIGVAHEALLEEPRVLVFAAAGRRGHGRENSREHRIVTVRIIAALFISSAFLEASPPAKQSKAM
jgi:hypothetical protein